MPTYKAFTELTLNFAGGCILLPELVWCVCVHVLGVHSTGQRHMAFSFGDSEAWVIFLTNVE